METVYREYSQDFWALGALPFGVALELLVGHPGGWLTPVRILGKTIELAERGLKVAVVRVGGGTRSESLAGLILVALLVGLVGSLGFLIAQLCDLIGGQPH